MKICLIGNGLTNLILAKILLKKKFKVDLYFKKRKNNSLIRTIGISSQNLKFLRQNIYNVNKIGWPINKIKIYNEKNKKKEILNFNSKKYPRFYIVKNIKIYNIINKNLKLEKNFLQKKINNNSFYTSIINNKNYDLIINSESQN